MLEYFTKIAPVTKAITLELRPYGKTRQTIDDLKHLEIDASFRADAERVKPIADDYIKEKIDDVLGNAGTEKMTGMFEKLGELMEQDGREAKKAQGELEDKIRKEIQALTEKAFPIRMTDLVTGKFIFDTLLEYVKGDPVKEDIIRSIKGKQNLLVKFMRSRTTIIQTWMPDRVIENFEIFHLNSMKYRTILGSPAKDLYAGLISDDMLESVGYVHFLRQEDIQRYNMKISGEIEESGIAADQATGTLKRGINGITNEYNQQIRGKKDEHALPKVKKLNKQILTPAPPMFTIAVLQSDSDVRAVWQETADIGNDILPRLELLIKSTPASGIFVPGNRLHALSYMIFGKHDKLTDIIRTLRTAEAENALENARTKTEAKKVEKQIAQIMEIIGSKKTFYSMEELSRLTGENIADAFRQEFSVRCSNLHHAGRACGEALESAQSLTGSDEKTVEAKKAIKTYFEDAWTDIRECIRIIRVQDCEDANNDLYDMLAEAEEPLRKTVTANNMVRNYVTRNVSKTLETTDAAFGAAGRNTNKWYSESSIDMGQNLLIRMDGRYYFYTIPAGIRPFVVNGEDTDIRILYYKKMQEPFQNLPKMTFVRAKKYFSQYPEAEECVITDKMTKPLVITREEYDIYASGNFKKGSIPKEPTEEELRSYREALETIIRVYVKFCLHYTEWTEKNFRFREPSEYDDISRFYDDVRKEAVTAVWRPGDKKAILGAVEEGRALMFEITSQSLKKYYETGDIASLNQYAGLFTYMLSEENLANMTVRMNSRPQLLYRQAANGRPYVHKKGSVLINKYDADGNRIPDETYKLLNRYFNRPEEKVSLPADVMDKYITRGKAVTRVAEYDIIKDRRFYREMFRITISYEKNTECKGTWNGLNAKVNALVRETPVNRIVLIRNNQDTVYMRVTDPEGNVLESRSLNIIGGKDYNQRLRELEEMNRADRANAWEYTGKIENERSGYFNKAVAEIVRAVVKYDAIIIMERISDRTRDKGFALGNTAYKKFEAKLTARLADLYFPKTEDGMPGSMIDPYQLCDPTSTNSFQNGIVYYVSGRGIAVTDHESGFMYDFNTSGINTKDARRRWLLRFDDISYDADEKALHVGFRYDRFQTYTEHTDNEWKMKLAAGITQYDPIGGHNKFIRHPFEEIAADLKILGIDPKYGIMQALENDKIPGKTVSLLYDRIIKCLRGTVGSHDGIRRMTYVSPVTRTVTDFSENQAVNLENKYLEYMH